MADSSQCSRINFKIDWTLQMVSHIPTILCCSETWRNDTCPIMNIPWVGEFYSRVIVRARSWGSLPGSCLLFCVLSRLKFVSMFRITALFWTLLVVLFCLSSIELQLCRCIDPQLFSKTGSGRTALLFLDIIRSHWSYCCCWRSWYWFTIWFTYQGLVY